MPCLEREWANGNFNWVYESNCEVVKNGKIYYERTYFMILYVPAKFYRIKN